MTIIRHGLSIGMERSGSDFYLTFTPVGKLTHADYEVIIPMIDSAIEGVKHPEIKALVDIRELEGWEPRAAWDDLKLGVKHGREFKKIAIIGNKRWQELAAKVGGWFIAGEIQYFEERDPALKWLND
jgi:hypothetical protein